MKLHKTGTGIESCDRVMNFNCNLRGLYQLVMKYWQFGVGEVTRSLSLSQQVRQLQRYVPELRVEDVTR